MIGTTRKQLAGGSEFGGSLDRVIQAY